MNYYPQLEHDVKEMGGIAAFVENIYENGYENGFKECYALSKAYNQQQCINKAVACQIITNSLRVFVKKNFFITGNISRFDML